MMGHSDLGEPAWLSRTVSEQQSHGAARRFTPRARARIYPEVRLSGLLYA